MSAAGRPIMKVVLFVVVLVLAAPLILYASPLFIYVVPFILAGLGLSLFADYIRHQERASRH